MFVFDVLLNNKAAHREGTSSTDIVRTRSEFSLTRKLVCYQSVKPNTREALISTPEVSLLSSRGLGELCVCVSALICMHGVIPRTDLTLGYLLSPLASLSHTE